MNEKLELLCICGSRITTPNDSYLCHHCLKNEMNESWGNEEIELSAE